MNGIDLELAQKVVGAGGNTNRAVDIKWEPVDRLDTWRFGLATATGLTFPDRLIDAAPPQLRAWQAAAPLLSPQDRLASAQIAAGLGVFSSQSMIDLYSTIYDANGPDDQTRHAERHCRAMTHAVIAELPALGFELTRDDVVAWLEGGPTPEVR